MNIVPRRFFLDDLFNDFDEGSIKPVNMKCDIYEKEGNYCIEMDLPGYDKKDIDIDFDSTKRYKSSQKKVCYEVMSINQSLEKIYKNNPSITYVLNLVSQKVKIKNK